MNKQRNEAAVFANIDNLLARWRKELMEPVADKPDLAEEGINLLYRKAGKKPPLILWCDSPIQITLIPTLVANVLLSDDWATLVANMKTAGKPDSAQWISSWKSQWTRVEKNTVLRLLDKIWNFQFKNESATTQQKVLDRLAEHLCVILKDGRLNRETVHHKQIKKSKNEVLPGPLMFDMWRRFVKLTAEIEQKTTTEFSLSATVAQGLVLGVFDHRAVTKHIPIARELLKPNEEKKQLLERIQHIRAKCSELERISTTRAAWLTEAMSGFMRPVFVPDIDPSQEWHEIMWNTIDGVRKDAETRQADPRANSLVVWGASASWLPLALSCRMLDSSFLSDLENEIDGWAYMFHGAAGYYLGDLVCFVCRQPKTLVTNDSGQPHNSFGAAATWSDGFDVHSWRGLIVEPDLIKQAHAVTIKQILSEENAERRRILLDMFGDERFVRESGAKIIHKDKHGVLYRYAFNTDEPLAMVRVRNSTRELDGSYKDYYLRVPPDMATAKEAVAWTFGLSADEYAPEYES